MKSVLINYTMFAKYLLHLFWDITQIFVLFVHQLFLKVKLKIFV